MFLAPDGTFWIQLANFAIFFVLLNAVFLKPVSQAIKKRRDYVNSVTSDYDRYQAEAKELRDSAERARAEARREAERVIAKARADASDKTAELSAEYAAKVQALVERANATAAGELQAARANEDALVAQLAGVVVDRAIGEGAK